MENLQALTMMVHNFKKKIILFWILLGILSGNLSAAQNSDETFTKNSVYEKKIIFQEIWSDYLIFYDIQKHIYYLKYRKDKWDYENNKKIIQFVQGIEYTVSFQFIDTIVEVNEIENIFRNKKTIEKETLVRKIRDKKDVYVGVYKSHKQTVIEYMHY